MNPGHRRDRLKSTACRTSRLTKEYKKTLALYYTPGYLAGERWL